MGEILSRLHFNLKLIHQANNALFSSKLFVRRVEDFEKNTLKHNFYQNLFSFFSASFSRPIDR
jgi:hypothetical protein